MNRTAKGWLTDARSHINAAIEMFEKSDQTAMSIPEFLLRISDARLAMNKAANALPGVPSTFAFPPDPDPEGLAQIAKLDAAEHIEWIEQQSIDLPNVHIGLLHGHKAVITNTGIDVNVWQVEIGTFIATFDSLERAKQSAEIVLRDRAKRRTDRDQFQWNDTVDEGFGVVSASEFFVDGQLANVRRQNDGTYKVRVNDKIVGGAIHLEDAQNIAIEYINQNIGKMVSPPNLHNKVFLNSMYPAPPPPSEQRITDYERSYQSALTLANALHDRKAPVNDGWKPEGDLPGLILQIDNMVAGLIIESTEAPDPVPQLSADYQSLKDAGNAMAAASFRVATEYDGCHRLMLAVSDWARAVANEGGRGDAK